MSCLVHACLAWHHEQANRQHESLRRDGCRLTSEREGHNKRQQQEYFCCCRVWIRDDAQKIEAQRETCEIVASIMRNKQRNIRRCCCCMFVVHAHNEISSSLFDLKNNGNNGCMCFLDSTFTTVLIVSLSSCTTTGNSTDYHCLLQRDAFQQTIRLMIRLDHAGRTEGTCCCCCSFSLIMYVVMLCGSDSRRRHAFHCFWPRPVFEYDVDTRSFRLILKNWPAICCVADGRLIVFSWIDRKHDRRVSLGT